MWEEQSSLCCTHLGASQPGRCRGRESGEPEGEHGARVGERERERGRGGGGGGDFELVHSKQAAIFGSPTLEAGTFSLRNHIYRDRHNLCSPFEPFFKEV